MSTYSQAAQADIARINSENESVPSYLKFAGIAGSLQASVGFFAAKADTEAAHNRHILGSLSEYEKACTVRSLEWDEVSDHLAFLLAGLEMRYDDCQPSWKFSDVRDAFRKLEDALAELDNVKNAQDVLDAHTDALIKARKEAVTA